MDYAIRRLDELEETSREQMMEIFLECFGNVFSTITKEKDQLRALFAPSFDWARVFVAVEDGQVLGFVALADGEGRSLKIDKALCERLFGRVKGWVLHGQLEAMLCRVNVRGAGVCYIDFLGTGSEARGKGVGTALLTHALSLGYEACTLEVLERNAPARRLYEKQGFRVEKITMSLPKILGGFGRTVFMKKEKCQ